jgi:hypothetical protein
MSILLAMPGWFATIAFPADRGDRQSLQFVSGKVPVMAGWRNAGMSGGVSQSV